MSRKTKQILARVSGIILLTVLALFIDQYRSTPDNKTSKEVINRADIIEVHFIDVGQGDAILIETGGAAMLIDAGENNKGSIVVDYLEAQNITKLDYVVGTHPHSDHIGGLDTVLNTFLVDKVILPAVTHTTKIFEDVLDSLEKKNLKITKAVVGDQYFLGSAIFTVVAPNSSSYEELNNYSVGIQLTYGDSTFLLVGDAEKISEDEIIENGIDLTADVLKLSHHGSAYSSSDEFLSAVTPAYAVISVGNNNEYGHPHEKTLQAILDRGIKLYRTDIQGTIVFTSDGKTISVNTGDYKIMENNLKH